MPAVPAPDSGFKARQEEEAGGQGSVWLRRRTGVPFPHLPAFPSPCWVVGGVQEGLRQRWVSREPPGVLVTPCQLMLCIFWVFFFFLEVTPQWESALCFWLLLL